MDHSWISQHAKDGRAGQTLGTLCVRPGPPGQHLRPAPVTFNPASSPHFLQGRALASGALAQRDIPSRICTEASASSNTIYNQVRWPLFCDLQSHW